MMGLRLKMSVFLLTYQDDWAQITKGGWGVFKPQKYYNEIQNIEIQIMLNFLTNHGLALSLCHKHSLKLDLR